MSRSPEDFRGLSPAGIMALLLGDAVVERQQQAREDGAKCVRCFDTGMAGAVFCSCSAGAKLAFQANRK